MLYHSLVGNGNNLRYDRWWRSRVYKRFLGCRHRDYEGLWVCEILGDGRWKMGGDVCGSEVGLGCCEVLQFKMIFVCSLRHLILRNSFGRQLSGFRGLRY